jgi:hypothetical protein
MWWILFKGFRGDGFWEILQRILVYYMNGFGTRVIVCLGEVLVQFFTPAAVEFSAGFWGDFGLVRLVEDCCCWCFSFVLAG